MNNKDLIKLKFMELVSDALSKLDNKYKECLMPIIEHRIFKEIDNARFYYYCHYWFCLDLNPNMEKTKGYKSVTALLIKPYRISEDDIIKSQNDSVLKKNKSTEGNFEENKNELVAYDKKTGNFHKQEGKISEIKFQVVLANQSNGANRYGPGWGEQEEFYTNRNLFKKDGRIVKTDWYIPGLDEESCAKTDKVEELTELLIRAIDAVYGITKKEQK